MLSKKAFIIAIACGGLALSSCSTQNEKSVAEVCDDVWRGYYELYIPMAQSQLGELTSDELLAELPRASTRALEKLETALVGLPQGKQAYAFDLTELVRNVEAKLLAKDYGDEFSELLTEFVQVAPSKLQSSFCELSPDVETEMGFDLEAVTGGSNSEGTSSVPEEWPAFLSVPSHISLSIVDSSENDGTTFITFSVDSSETLEKQYRDLVDSFFNSGMKAVGSFAPSETEIKVLTGFSNSQKDVTADIYYFNELGAIQIIVSLGPNFSGTRPDAAGDDKTSAADPDFPCATAEFYINEGTASEELIANYLANCN